MAVYNCECGLIISTSSDRPRCLRCLSVLGPKDIAGGDSEPAINLAVAAAAVIALRGQLRQVAMGYPLNERPVLSPVVRPK